MAKICSRRLKQKTLILFAPVLRVNIFYSKIIINGQTTIQQKNPFMNLYKMAKSNLILSKNMTDRGMAYYIVYNQRNSKTMGESFQDYSWILRLTFHIERQPNCEMHYPWVCAVILHNPYMIYTLEQFTHIPFTTLI